MAAVGPSGGGAPAAAAGAAPSAPPPPPLSTAAQLSRGLSVSSAKLTAGGARLTEQTSKLFRQLGGKGSAEDDTAKFAWENKKS